MPCPPFPSDPHFSFTIVLDFFPLFSRTTSAHDAQVASLSKIGQERRKKRKAARYARQRRRSASAGTSPGSDLGSGIGDSAAATAAAAAAAAVAVAKNGGRTEGTDDDVGDDHDDGDEAVRRRVSGDAEGADDGEGVAAIVKGGAFAKPGPVEPEKEQEEEEERLRRQHEQQDPPRRERETEEAEEGEEEEEEAIVEEEEEEVEGEAETWFLMAGTWLSRWHAYVLSGTGEDLDFPTPPPGPITNGDLVDEDGEPLPGKVAGKHYR